jgi:hypothetical protein
VLPIYTTVENPVAVGGGDADAAIGHIDAHRFAATTGAEHDAAAA